MQPPIFAEISALKYPGAILFLLAFVALTFSKTFIVAGYYANTAAYAKNCENKAKPNMRCNGKCQMMKKLKQEENKDKQNPDRKTDNKDEVLFPTSFFGDGFFIVGAGVKTQKILLRLGVKPVNRSLDIFHPPKSC